MNKDPERRREVARESAKRRRRAKREAAARAPAEQAAPARPSSKRQAPRGAGGRRGAVTLTMPLTVEEADEFDRHGRAEFDCYPVFSSMADVVRHSLLLWIVGDRGEWESPEYESLLSSCLASGCACPVESDRDGQIWRHCAAAGEPCLSVGRPIDEAPQRRVLKQAPAWSGEGRGAVTLTMALTRAEADEFDRHGRDTFTCYPRHSSLADVVRHEVLVNAAFNREVADEAASEAFDAYVDMPEAERSRVPDPTPEYSALLSACPASGCACPVESDRDGRIWRRCAAVGGAPRWSVGRPVGDEEGQAGGR